MIDEKKLIEKIKKWIDLNEQNIVNATSEEAKLWIRQKVNFYYHLLTMIEEQPKISLENKTSDWIPVEEALPKELQRVLVQKITGTIEVLRYYGEKNKWGGDSYHNVHPRLIKAWQPLPQKYEG